MSLDAPVLFADVFARHCRGRAERGGLAYAAVYSTQTGVDWDYPDNLNEAVCRLRQRAARGAKVCVFKREPSGGWWLCACANLPSDAADFPWWAFT